MKELKRDWIRQCLFEYVALHLDGMEGYFRDCWKEARQAVSGVPGYKKWFEWTRVSGTVCDMIGEYWLDCFKGKEKEFKEFMDRIDFSGYVNQFKEDFEVEIVWVCHQGGSCFLRDRLDIDVKML